MSLIVRNRYRRPQMTSGAKFALAKRAITETGKLYRKWKSTRRQQPARLKVSRKRYNNTRRVENFLRNFSGSKYKGYTGDCLTPVGKPSGAQPISYHFYNMGKTLASLPEMNNMDLYTFANGDGNNERVGDYMMLRNTTLKMEVQALPLVSVGELGQPILEFRLMVVKSNRKYNSFEQSPDPGSTLFLDNENNEFGYDDTVQSVFAYQRQPLNKRKWIVLREQKFKLSIPFASNSALGNTSRLNPAYPKYPTKKNFRINVPIHKKTHFNNVDNTPDNLDTQTFVILQCTHGSYCDSGTRDPTEYVVNFLGTTSAYDN